MQFCNRKGFILHAGLPWLTLEGDCHPEDRSLCVQDNRVPVTGYDSEFGDFVI